MRRSFVAAVALFALLCLPVAGLAANTITLTGKNLTLEQVEDVARNGAKVSLDKEAMKRVELSHRLLLQSAREGKNVYGLNTGVGINKDRVVFTGDVLSADARKASENFNRIMIMTHAVSVGPAAPEDVVRASLLIRLNRALNGYSAFHPDIVNMYVSMLNAGVHPVMPMQGTVGVGDITMLPYVGLVMMGEHEAFYKGKRMSGAEALKQAGLKSVKPYAKDGLTLLSTNSFSSALACLAVLDAERLLDTANTVFSLSLEGLNGNISPFLAETLALRPLAPTVEVAKDIRANLAGSYLYSDHPKRPMQDPLSFRDVATIHSAVLDSLESLREIMVFDINHQDDNPGVVVDGKLDDPNNAFLNKRYVVSKGEVKGLVLGTANFDPLVWVTELERLGIAFSHMGRASAHRVLKLASGRFTNLPRNLAPDNANIGYLTIQKTVSALDAEIRALSMPISVDVLPLSGEIEDVGTNAGLVVSHLVEQMDRLYKLMAIETLHSTRAMGLRNRDAKTPFGAGTGKLFDAVNKVVPAVGPDRIQGPDIMAVVDVLQNFGE